MKARIKRIISVALVLVMMMSLVCITTNAVEGEITYSFIVTCNAGIAGFEGEISYPSALSVKQESGQLVGVSGLSDAAAYGIKDGKLSFNDSFYPQQGESNLPFDFSKGKALISVVFKVNGAYEASQIKTELTEFYSTTQVKGVENTPYTFTEQIDGNNVNSGYVDIDESSNNLGSDYIYTITTGASAGKTINLMEGFYRDAEDSKNFGIPRDETFRRAQLLGLQKKKVGKSVRFVAVINSEIAKDADEYGFLGAADYTVEDARTKVEGLTLETAKDAQKCFCKGTNNNVCNEYGEYDTDTSYKYVTFAVTNIGDLAVAARFFIKKGDKIYFCQFRNNQGEYFNSYSYMWK